jgi:hypothetical protein
LELWPHAAGALVVVDRALEAAIPFHRLGVHAGDRLRFSVLVADETGVLLDHQPPAPVAIEVPNRHLEAVNWTV